MRVRRPMSIAAGAAAVATVAAVLAGGSSAAAGSPAAAASAVVRISPDAVHAMPVDRAGPPSTQTCESQFKIACYTPLQVQQAYNPPKLYSQDITGAGQTIVIVDSFGSPTVRHDLAKFDSTFGLPAPPSFNIIQPAGKVPAYKADRTGKAGPARPTWTSSTRTRWPRARTSCWSRRPPRRTRARPASRRSSRPRSA